MSVNLRNIGTILAALVLFGCAATTANVAKNPNCLTETGSNIPAAKSDCREFGRSYTKEDIARTGATSAAGAVGLLDPSITVHH
jgi:hypothetical protein